MRPSGAPQDCKTHYYTTFNLSCYAEGHTLNTKVRTREPSKRATNNLCELLAEPKEANIQNAGCAGGLLWPPTAQTFRSISCFHGPDRCLAGNPLPSFFTCSDPPTHHTRTRSWSIAGLKGVYWYKVPPVVVVRSLKVAMSL